MSAIALSRHECHAMYRLIRPFAAAKVSSLFLTAPPSLYHTLLKLHCILRHNSNPGTPVGHRSGDPSDGYGSEACHAIDPVLRKWLSQHGVYPQCSIYCFGLRSAS
jgi:hypothetical protein